LPVAVLLLEMLLLPQLLVLHVLLLMHDLLLLLLLLTVAVTPVCWPATCETFLRPLGGCCCCGGWRCLSR
jgi:hypothetical protein